MTFMTHEPHSAADAYQAFTAPLDWPVREARECGDWGIDPGSGAVIRRLTTEPFQHNAIYTEQPYTSPDGKRIAICRRRDAFIPGCELIVGDVVSGQMWLMEPSIVPGQVANAAYSGWIHYHTFDGGVRRVCLMTLKKEQVIGAGEMPSGCQIYSVTPDQSTALVMDRRDSECGAISIMPLATGEQTVIFRDRDNQNPHAQLDQVDGSRVLYQKCKLEDDYPLEVFVHDRTTGRTTQLPFGGEHTANPSGHMAWIGQTDAVACLVEWRRAERLHDERHPEGNLAIAAPGDDKPRVIGGPGHAYWQVSVSRCGRYFVCNDWMDVEGNYWAGTDVLYDSRRGSYRGALRLVMGSFETRRTRTLITDAPGTGLGHYLTADNRYVVYAGLAWDLHHVFAAEVPEGFLEGLG